jgi:glycosyltransferase involved in cell wall biosynthesis
MGEISHLERPQEVVPRVRTPRMTETKATVPEHALGTVIHAGPRMNTPGGMAGVMRYLRDSSLAQEWQLVFVESIARDRPLPIRVWQSALFVLRVAAALVRYPEAMLHVHMAQRGSFRRKRVAISLARLAGRPVVVHIHGNFFDEWASANARRRRVVARVLERCTAVVVLGESWRERILAVAGSARCVVIRNGVTMPVEPTRGSSPPLVVFLGRLETRKGIHELLEAMRSIQDRGVEASWVLAGDGDAAGARREADSLRHPELVEVPGFLWSKEKDDLFSRGDVFVLPSFSEGLPVALLEAMSFGLACVASPVGGIPEVLIDGENGLFCTPGDVQSIEHALLSVLEDSALARRLGQRARQTVAECCSMDSIARQWSALYEELAEGPKA